MSRRDPSPPATARPRKRPRFTGKHPRFTGKRPRFTGERSMFAGGPSRPPVAPWELRWFIPSAPPGAESVYPPPPAPWKPHIAEPHRHWIENKDPLLSILHAEARVVIASYNILGDFNASEHPELYANVPFKFMKWDSRKVLICNEIRKWKADIVCLQEVDRYHDILCIMKNESYKGLYKRRTGEAKDGCAILWNSERFRLLDEEGIEFADFGLRDNVAQLLVFEANVEDNTRRILIGNIHVLFNPKRGDIKLGQVRMLLQKAHALSEKWGNIPIVLAGDFNSVPQSAIYEFISNSEVNVLTLDRRTLSGQNLCQNALLDHPRLNFKWTEEELKNATGSANCTVLKNPLKLCSSYASIKGNNGTRGPFGEPSATTYHSSFLGTVDYLWYTDGLASARVLDTLPIDTLRRVGGLPCKSIGSDHLALVAEFVFR